MEETLGLSLIRSSRSSKVFPLENYDGYVGDSNASGVPHGQGSLTFEDKSLLWMSGGFSSDSDNLYNGVYNGGFKHGKRHDFGTFKFADGRIFEGTWANDEFVKGKMQYANGDSFEGCWIRGLKDNRGVYHYANGTRYDGYWKKNEKHGVGVVVAEDGSRGVGWQCWANNKIIESELSDCYGGDVDSAGRPHGQGTVLHMNGDVYDGSFQSGVRQGLGTLYHPETPQKVEVAYVGHWRDGLMDGEGFLREFGTSPVEEIEFEFKGTFVRGLKHGFGVETNLLTGECRRGEWIDNELSGNGKSFYPSDEVGGPGGVKYDGGWLKGVFHGTGVLWESNGNVYKGKFFEGMKGNEGSSHELYMDGSVYKGSFCRNLREGEGEMTFSDGSTYVGMWSSGRFHGHGLRCFADGAQYEGNYICGLQEGIGTFLFHETSEALKYVGNWTNGKPNGKGVETYRDGSVYSGEMSNGRRHGSGQMAMSTSEVYDGLWVKGKMEGIGKYVYRGKSVTILNVYDEEETIKGRDTYTGEWFNNERHGHGQLEFCNGDVYVGSWKEDMREGDGKLVHRDGRKYEGCFVKGMKHGTGTQKWPEGAVYTGDWRNGSMHGVGTYRYADGRNYEGLFVFGKPHGEGSGMCADDRHYHRGIWEDGEPVKINRKGNREKSVFRVSLPILHDQSAPSCTD